MNNPVEILNAACVAAIASMTTEQITEWRALNGLGDADPLTVLWPAMHRWTPEHRAAIAAAIGALFLAGRASIGSLGFLSGRIVVGVQCKVARSLLLPMVLDADDREHAIAALDAAERWVRGELTRSDRNAIARRAMAAVEHRETSWYGPDDADGSPVKMSEREREAFAACVSPAVDGANVTALVKRTAERQGISRELLAETIAAAMRDVIDAAAVGATTVESI